jgi:hypothetical protein
VPLVEVCLTRPSWRQAMVVGSLTLLTLGSSGASLTASPPSAAQAQPEPTATAPAADPTAQDSPDPVAVWRNPPQTYEVRPPAPGQQIQDVTFLADGRLAIRVQAADGYQVWLHEPATGARSHVATCKDSCALEPDGTVAMLSGNFEGEQLTDISVSPSGAHAVLVTKTLIDGYEWSRLRWVNGADVGKPQDFANQPVPGSIVWRPDEQAIALVVHSVPTAALIEAGPTEDDGSYLGDNSIDGTAGAPVAPVSWSPDLSRRVFGGIQGAAAPSATTPLQLFDPASATSFGLLISDGSGIPATPFGKGGMSPQWLSDGRLLAVGNDSSGLVLRLVEADGTATLLSKLGIQVSSPTSYAARWDLEHHRLLVLVNRTDAIGARDAYLVSF